MITVVKEPFDVTESGEAVDRYRLKNNNGMEVTILSYGAVIQNLIVPDRESNPVDVVLGYDTLKGYEEGSCFFGTFVGRYANRIKNAEFTLNGEKYVLPKNDGNNHLHGILTSRVMPGRVTERGVTFACGSPDGEEGFPGNLSIRIAYELDEENQLTITYTAVTDRDTVLNLTNHSYFNLNGQDGSQMLDQILTLHADSFTEGDSETLPTGEILPVEGTPMDFRSGKAIGKDIRKPYKQLKLCQGYDHNFILNGSAGDLRLFAEVLNPANGIIMTAYTTQPASQLYTGNFLEGDTAPHGKHGIRYPQYGGFCLETQHYPCSPNFEQFPTTVLHPKEVYKEITVYQFKA